MWVNAILVIFLAVCCVQDLKRRAISRRWLLAGCGAAALVQAAAGRLSWPDFAAGVLVGAALLPVAFVTREALGYGDGLAVAVIGMFLGGAAAVEVLLTALFLAAAVSACLLALRRVRRTYALPFLPFLAAALGLLWILGGGG